MRGFDVKPLPPYAEARPSYRKWGRSPARLARRSTQRKVPRARHDEQRLTADIIELAWQYGRYGYRKLAALLRQAGWTIKRQAGRVYLATRGAEGPHKQVSSSRRSM